MKVVFIFLTLCLVYRNFVISMNWTNDNNVSETEDKDSLSSTICPDEFEDFCNKKSNRLENLFRVFFNKKYGGANVLKNKRLSSTPLHTSLNTPCHCEMTFRPIDLGRNVYPRFFHTGVCKKSTCGVFLRCQPKKYKIRILRKKDEDLDTNMDFQEVPENVFPESLQDDWVPDYVSIVVGCECIPKKI